MSDDRVPPSHPDAERRELARDVRPLRDHEASTRMADDLVEVADDLRQMYTDFGLRPYRVFLVHVRWSGERRGEGHAQEIARTELLPTPQVSDVGGVSEILGPTGLQELGQVVVNRISVKYAEDDLMGLTPDLQDPASPRTSQRNVQFFWEIMEHRKSWRKPRRRVFTPSAAPSLSKDGFSWRVSLVRKDYEPSRDGVHTPRETF